MKQGGSKKWAAISVVLIVLVGIGMLLTFILPEFISGRDKQETSILTGTALAEMLTPDAEGQRTDLFDSDDVSGEPNHLIDEKSPYLVSHAYNLVDWYPWGPEAFEKARQENKPIFLSIGYSTCHWCHVMEEESFKDPQVAQLMNDTFVAILVDREERPDIDSLYTTTAVLLGGNVGWPLNILMTHDQKPFYATTYIPKENRFGRIGMLDLISQLQEAWGQQNADLQEIAEQVSLVMKTWSSTSSRGQLELNAQLLDSAFQGLLDQYDPDNGGFGTVPKFPAPHKLFFLLRYWERTGDEAALTMVEDTLQAMRRGAIYDQLGFGFHRYAVDAQWNEPHFEKMLYDQALLAMAYTEAYQATGKAEYARTAQKIFIYVLRDLSAPSGGFYAAEDADTEREEGRFYIWTIDEIKQALNEADAQFAIDIFGLTEPGNYIDPVINQPLGINVLYLRKPLSELADDFRTSEQELRSRVEATRKLLFDARAKRIQPHRDEKILADWNGLMIAAFAKAGQVFNEPIFTQAARNSADFILDNLRDENSRLLHRYWDGDADLAATVNDYAFLTWGLIELYETNFDVRYLEQALALTDELVAYFWDEDEGGFYQTPNDGEELLVRQKLIDDNDLPSGNSVAMLNLLRLGRITANTGLEEKAVELANAFAAFIERSPSAYSMLMCAINFGLGPSYEVVIAGDPDSQETATMLSALRAEFFPNKIVVFRPPGESPEILKYAEYARYNTSLQGKATAYVCLNYYCELPTSDIEQMLALLRSTP